MGNGRVSGVTQSSQWLPMSVPPAPTMLGAPPVGPPGLLLSMKRYPKESGPPVSAGADDASERNGTNSPRNRHMTVRTRRWVVPNGRSVGAAIGVTSQSSTLLGSPRTRPLLAASVVGSRYANQSGGLRNEPSILGGWARV